MPTVFRKKGRRHWWFVYRDPDTGERRWKNTRVPNDQPKSVAVARAAALERAELLRGPDRVRLELASALDELAKAKRRRGAAAVTLEILVEKGKRLIEFFGATRELHGLELADVEAYVDARRKTVSRHTVAKELGALREALRHAAKHGRFEGDPGRLYPADALRGAYQPRDRWLTPGEYRRLLAALQPEWRDHVVVLTHTGIDRGDLFALRPWHLDRARRILAVPGAKGRPREIPVPAVAWAVLERRAEADDMFGRKTTATALTSALRRAAKRAGIAHVSPKDLRRTFASWAANAGVPELTVARLMGHRSSAMVRRVYAQLARETLEGAVGMIGSYGERRGDDELEGSEHEPL